MKTFRVVCNSKLYAGWWIVLRSDGRMMHADPDVRMALRWVRTWGDTAGQQRKGTAASHRLTEAVGCDSVPGVTTNSKEA